MKRVQKPVAFNRTVLWGETPNLLMNILIRRLQYMGFLSLLVIASFFP